MELPSNKLPRNKSLFYQKLSQLLSDLYPVGEVNAVMGLLEDFINQTERTSTVEFSETTYTLVSKLASRLLQAEPIQYVLGEAHFYGRDFKVTPEVLIPRSETEELVIWIRDDLIRYRNPAPPQILDIGTGSGCIPVTLKLELADMRMPAIITGIDISEGALTVAKANAARWDVSAAFILQDIFEAKSDDFAELDVIVSNPPYVRETEKADMHRNVLDYEPAHALFVADHNPLIFYKKIVECSASWLRPGGRLFLEINEALGAQVIQLMETSCFKSVELRRDLQGKDRMIRAEKI